VIIMLKIFINFTLDNPNALSICGFVNKWDNWENTTTNQI
jgi:hypothetical protein